MSPPCLLSSQLLPLPSRATGAAKTGPAGRVGGGRGRLHLLPRRRLRAEPDLWVWAAWGRFSQQSGMATATWHGQHSGVVWLMDLENCWDIVVCSGQPC